MFSRIFAAALLFASSSAMARETQVQRQRRDVVARELLTALDDAAPSRIQDSVTTLSGLLTPEGVAVYEPLKVRLLTLVKTLEATPAKVSVATLRAFITETTDLFGVEITPSQTPDIAAARAYYAGNCRSCHGETGAGDGPLSGKVKGGVPSFVSGPVSTKSPFSYYQKIALGRPDTAMPGYGKKLEPLEIWSLAFLTAGFDAASAKDIDLAPLLKAGLSMERLSRMDDAELAAWTKDPSLVPALRSRAPGSPSVPRLSPR